MPGVRAGGFLFLSAIRGRDPKSGTMVEEPLAQARQALRNVEAVLVASGATLAHVVKVTLVPPRSRTPERVSSSMDGVFPERSAGADCGRCRRRQRGSRR